MLKQLVQIADFLDKSRKEGDANLIDYFISKFAENDPSNLKDIYDSIPKEERADFRRAFAGIELNDIDPELEEGYEDEELQYVFDQLKKSPGYDPEHEIYSDESHSVKLGDLFSKNK